MNQMFKDFKEKLIISQENLNKKKGKFFFVYPSNSKNLNRRLFTVEETHIATQKEYRELTKKIDSIKPIVNLEKKNMTSKLKSLEHQVEQAK